MIVNFQGESYVEHGPLPNICRKRFAVLNKQLGYGDEEPIKPFPPINEDQRERHDLFLARKSFLQKYLVVSNNVKNYPKRDDRRP